MHEGGTLHLLLGLDKVC